MRHSRLIALFAACALLMSSALYASHGFGDLNHGHSHCDLCVHLGGSAGTTPAAAPAGKPALATRVPVAAARWVVVTRAPCDAYLARGPPVTPA